MDVSTGNTATVLTPGPPPRAARDQLRLVKSVPDECEGHPGVRAVLDAVAQAIEQPTLRAGAAAVAAHLATEFGCERVSIGLQADRRLRLVAVSRHGAYDERMTLSRSILAAMEEAIDQDAAVMFPPPAGDKSWVATAHGNLCQDLGQSSACSIPICSLGRLAGAVTFEHESAARFDPQTVALLEAIVGFIGPILEARRREERGAAQRAKDELRDLAIRLTGPRHVALKLLTGAGLLLTLVGILVNGTYHVTAEAVLRGSVQRLVVAPIDSFVAGAPVRAGDVVSEGQVLATLDDRVLQLEQLKWQSERERVLNEYREAMAALDSIKVSILRAQVDRATAELQLTSERLARTRIVAPLAGVVVSGDLTQAIGAPVKQGDTLFEVAPLDDYRVMLEVDERDIAAVVVGQRGRLALAGFPGDRLEFLVARITPVSKVADGRNYFSVEGQLIHMPKLLRPGMQGVAKLDIGARRLGWIWSHRIIEWFELHLWYWWPWR